ncbi:chorismate mutase [Nocardia paucivorans]|uniref:chorismate mutase n=1 Tax=Nocardia paucivorans TaxID=114259 RepID=UPI001C3F2C4C|nr:chorismate mutase [Nocardia paucivorans]
MSANTTMMRGIAVVVLTVAGAISPIVPHAMAEPPGSALTPSGSPGPLGALTDLVTDRLHVSDDVAAAKFGTGSPIDDPVRERQVLDQVRVRADTLGLDPNAVTAFFRDQINASKVVQRGLFARWTAHPNEAPTTRPDLGRIRIQLDRLTTALLEQLDATVDARTEPVPCVAHLTLAAGSTVVAERLDALHGRALGTAVRSICVPSPRETP